MNDARIVTVTGMFVKKPASAIVTIAKNILAPDEMPSTNGPAMGLLKKVCNRFLISTTSLRLLMAQRWLLLVIAAIK